MVSQIDTDVTVVCGDGERVALESVSIGRSQRLQTLPSLPEEINVPFSRQEVATWKALSGEEVSTKSLTECLSALKVLMLLHLGQPRRNCYNETTLASQACAVCYKVPRML